MTKKLLFVLTILLIASFALMAADVSGKWTYEGRGRGGGGDNPPPPIAITDGKVDGNNISFTVKREFNGNTIVQKYEGVVNGDEIKLKIIRNGQDGAPVTYDVVAKRVN